MEKKYDLVPTDKINSSQRGDLKKVDYGHGDLKMQIANVVRPVVEQYRFQSLKELRAVLSLYNVTVEETRSAYNDKVLHGIIYAAADDTGKRVGRCINSSKIGKEVGYFALQNKYSKSKEWMNHHPIPDTTKQVISAAIRSSMNKDDLMRNLKYSNIDAILFQNDTGRIYGVTYIDHNSKSVFKGSALGKEFSANALHMAFENSNTESNYHPQEDHSFDQAGRGNDLVGGILDIFNMNSGGMAEEFQQENEAQRLIRKKKKKKQGMHL